MLPADAAWGALLSALLAAACAHDLRARRIPNALVAATLGAGIVRAGAGALLPPAAAFVAGTAPGVGAAALGVLLGLAAWLPLYALGMLGAGDVKLFAAGAAWLGPAGVWPASVWAAAAGAAVALLWLLRPRGAARRTAAGRAASVRDRRLPYGLAVSAGLLAAAWTAAGATP